MSRYNEMTNKELEKSLFDYGRTRKGEISEITFAASVRLGVLDARVKVLTEKIKELEAQREDDLK